MSNLNILNKIGFWFFNNIDKRGLIFNALKNQNKATRIIIYGLLLIATFFSINYLNSYFLLKLSNYSLVKTNIDLFENLFMCINIIVITLESSLIFYESIYKYGLEELNAYRDSKSKKNFFSKWYIRIFLYLIVFLIVSQIIYFALLNFSLEQYGSISNVQNNQIILQFNNEVDKKVFENVFISSISNTFKSFYSFFFITIFLYEIYLLRKKYDNRC